MKKGKYKTVLFEIKDEDVFKEQWDLLCESMQHGIEISGTIVVGLSHEDEFERVRYLEEMQSEDYL